MLTFAHQRINFQRLDGSFHRDFATHRWPGPLTQIKAAVCDVNTVVSEQTAAEEAMKCPYCFGDVTQRPSCSECGTTWIPGRPQDQNVPDSARVLMARRWLNSLGGLDSVEENRSYRPFPRAA